MLPIWSTVADGCSIDFITYTFFLSALNVDFVKNNGFGFIIFGNTCTSSGISVGTAIYWRICSGTPVILGSIPVSFIF